MRQTSASFRHWSDATTLEWLSLLVDQSPTARLLLLCTRRPEVTPPWPSRAHLTQLTLTRRPSPQAARLVASVVGTKVLPRDVVQQIVATTLTAQQARALNARAGKPALHVTRQYLDAQGRLLMATVGVYPSDRFSHNTRFRIQPDA